MKTIQGTGHTHILTSTPTAVLIVFFPTKSTFNLSGFMNCRAVSETHSGTVAENSNICGFSESLAPTKQQQQQQQQQGNK